MTTRDLPGTEEAAGHGRVFIALWPTAATAEAIASATAQFVGKSRGRAIHPADLHMTLAFLGELSPAQLDAAASVLRASTQAAFALRLDRLGCFRRARILWLAPHEPPVDLIELYERVWDRLASHGFTREERPFKAHITLARRSRPVRSRALASPIDWHVDSIVLATSRPDATGPPRYQALATQGLVA